MPRRRSQTTKSGRLRSSVKRRKLNESAPGAVVVFRKSKKSTNRRGQFTGKGRGLLELGIRFHDNLFFDGDCRKLIRYIQHALAEHYSQSVLAGVDPNTGAPHPALAESTKARSKGRSGGLGNRTGHTAKTWQVGVIGGHALQARGKVFASKDAEVLAMMSRLINRTVPVDFQSIDGKARAVIIAAIDEWYSDALGDGVATPSRADTSGGSFKEKAPKK